MQPSEYIFLDGERCEPPPYQQRVLRSVRPRTFVIATHLIEEIASILEKVIVVRTDLVTRKITGRMFFVKDTLLDGASSLVRIFARESS